MYQLLFLSLRLLHFEVHVVLLVGVPCHIQGVSECVRVISLDLARGLVGEGRAIAVSSWLGPRRAVALHGELVGGIFLFLE